MNKLKYDNVLAVDCGDDYIKRNAFVAAFEGDAFSEKSDFALRIRPMDFINTLKQVFVAVTKASKVHSEMDQPNFIDITSFYGNEPILFAQIFVGGAGGYRDERRRNFNVTLTGNEEHIFQIWAELRTRYGKAKIATVDWWYKRGEQITYKIIPLEDPLPIFDEYYPFLEGGIDKYIDTYLKDRASVLFMMGPAGTGKSSFIRHMIFTNDLEASITYDEKILDRDDMFINFLCDTDEGVLVIEDADNLVGSREKSGNKMMSRFLNVSDGLIRMDGKKIIFTTNTNSFKNVDEALLRPGRCFDAINFRALTYREACIAAERGGIPIPKKNKDYTLGQLFGHESEAYRLAESGFNRS